MKTRDRTKEIKRKGKKCNRRKRSMQDFYGKTRDEKKVE